MTTATAPVIPAQTGSRSSAHKMERTRKIALIGGLLYLLTFVASFPQLQLFAHLVDDPSGFISEKGSNASVLLGSWLEVVTALAGVGTALVLYPITRRVSRTAGIGFVASRVVEATMILVGVMSVLAVVSLKADFAGATGAQADSLRVTGEALVSLRQWTFLLGPGIAAGVNGLFLGYVMYRGGLVPRLIPIVGLIGAPIILVSDTSTIFGGWGQTSVFGFLCGLPIAIWELSLGIYLTFKGFKKLPAGVDA